MGLGDPFNLQTRIKLNKIDGPLLSIDQSILSSLRIQPVNSENSTQCIKAQ